MNTKLDIKPRRNWYMETVPCYAEHIRRYIEDKFGPEVLYAGGLKIYTTVNIEMQNTALAEIENSLRSLEKRQGYTEGTKPQPHWCVLSQKPVM